MLVVVGNNDNIMKNDANNPTTAIVFITFVLAVIYPGSVIGENYIEVKYLNLCTKYWKGQLEEEEKKPDNSLLSLDIVY